MAKIETTEIDYVRGCKEYKTKWLEKIANLPSAELCYLAGVAIQELCLRGFCRQEQLDDIRDEVDRHLVITDS